jgi:hypothetical protein
MSAQDKIAPFLRELGEVADQFRWIVCRKTGRIVGWNAQLRDHLSPIQVVAWAALTDGGRLYKGKSIQALGISEEYEAARVAGFETISHALLECCNKFCDKAWRKAVLVEIGLPWKEME